MNDISYFDTFARFTLTEVKELVYEGLHEKDGSPWYTIPRKLKITIGKLMDLMKNFGKIYNYQQ